MELPETPPTKMKMVRHGDLVLMWHSWEDEGEFPPLAALKIPPEENPTWEQIADMMAFGYYQSE